MARSVLTPSTMDTGPAAAIGSGGVPSPVAVKSRASNRVPRLTANNWRPSRPSTTGRSEWRRRMAREGAEEFKGEAPDVAIHRVWDGSRIRVRHGRRRASETNSHGRGVMSDERPSPDGHGHFEARVRT